MKSSVETITDQFTGLIWQRKTAEPMALEEAISYCKNLSLEGRVRRHKNGKIKSAHV